MSTDLGIIKGLIELEDNFTSGLGLAEAALSNFTKNNQESMKAVAGAVGIVTAAIGVAAAAVYNLGQRGADVNDVSTTLDHFAGSAANASQILENLRRGTKGTVDDFDLMSAAAHTLSAGVSLTAEDFGTLGSAAFVLQNRGLGGTKEMLDLVNDALVTGRTRSLAMALGVVDAGDAEANYAKKLGITKDLLSDTGKVEAKRIAIMELLNKAVKDAGDQQKDFGEKIEAAKVAVANWVDSLAVAIAQSPVLAAGMDSIERALSAAFSDDQTKGIDTVVHAIEQGAIYVVDFGIACIEMARVVHAAWSVVESIVLLVEADILGLVTAVTYAVEKVASVAETLKIVPEGTTQGIKDVREQLNGMTLDLAKQSAEAAKGIVGHSEFDKTLDKLGGTLMNVKDAMEQASVATSESGKVVDVAAENTRKLAATQAQLSDALKKRSIDQDALAKIEKKSIEETKILWNDYFALRISHGGTASEAQQAAIKAWFDDEVLKLNKSDKNWKEHYDALKNLASEKLRSIAVDWDFLAKNSIKALQDEADKARATYNEMIYHAENFTRGAMEEQKRKVQETADAARGMGKDFIAAEQAASTEAAKHTAALEEVKRAADEAAKAQRNITQSTQVDLSTQAGRDKVDPKIARWLHDGYSLEQASAIAYALAWGFQINQNDPLFKTKGPRVPGFAGGVENFEGGLAMVGEQGPELVNLPKGSSVTPMSGVGGTTIINKFYVNGTAEEVARKIQDKIMRGLSSQRQFSGS